VLHFTLKGWWLSMGLCVALAEIADASRQQRSAAAA
jgi:hypothetical protein